MRITFLSQYRDILADLNETQYRLTKFVRQVSSGRRLLAPSDDPVAAGAAIKEHAGLGALDRYASATDSTSARLTVVDTVLNDIIKQFTVAKTSAASARSTVTTSAQRQVIASELNGIKETLVSDLSTAYRGTYVFSGTKTTTIPYTITNGTVSAYQGNSASMSVDVDRQIAVPVSFDGESITRGSDAQDVFAAIDALTTAVQNGDSAGIDTGMAALDRAFDRATQVQSSVGTSLHRLDGQATRLTTIKQTVQARISALEDANLAEAITELEKAQTARQAALGAAATINQRNLMDYLR